MSNTVTNELHSASGVHTHVSAFGADNKHYSYRQDNTIINNTVNAAMFLLYFTYILAYFICS